ncbi:MAG: aromatic amino acid lyase [Bacteroidetes bacterium]|nr:MAG: aromatic amino acid lyase [Bacteroidota bacterium]RLD73569.1 MAG: aromatic amino acid lyase [Bacteroidota bacterium]RLD88648.1 MAG: aromatic amino acid lyase [Bacteroidota bacterium]
MITLSTERLKLDDYQHILFDNDSIILSDETLNLVEQSFLFLKEFSNNKVIYGVNTGLGPMAQYRVDTEDQINLQYNLIRSHAAGSGKPLPPDYVRSAMISRLKSLSLGYSGVHADAIKLLADLINKNIIPYIPEHGGVGASGDLVQLAHLALVLIGEGEVMQHGKRVATEKVFKENHITPLTIHLREGLGLINGTSVMSGIGIVNTIYAKRLINWSVLASAMINEIVQSFDDHFSHELNSTKQHRGQQIIAEAMRKTLKNSQLIKKRSDHLYNGKIEEKIFKQKIQEYYSLRCVPQILGPVCDTLYNTEEVLVNELNSVNDNPVVDMKTKTVYHGGNFHGDYVSFEMDKLKIATTKLSMLAERQVNFLMNHKLNEILPPFVNLGILGLNLGLQGTQFTATSTVAENQTMSNPVYVHSIPNNNDNQDIVSMGTNAALMAKKVIDNTFEVLAVEYLAIIQAIDYLSLESQLATETNKIFRELRTQVPVFTDDSPRYTDLEKIKNYLKASAPNIIG